MPPHSPAADAAARRLLAAAGTPSAAGGTGAPRRAPVAAAEQVSADLADTLVAWFGPYGTHALLTRALAQARTDHPALAAVRLRAPLAPVLEGLAGAAQAHGLEATTAGVTAVLAGVVGLLGRVIGEDMALQLVARSMDDSVPNVPDEPTPTGAPPDQRAP